MILQPFDPSYGRGVNNTVGATDVTQTIRSAPKQLCLTNIGTQVIYVAVRDPADTRAASVADYPVPPNSQQILSKATANAENVGYVLHMIAPGGAGSTLHVIEGEGF